MSQMIDQEVRRMMAAEADKDGKVTWPEIVAHSKASQANNSQAMNYGPGSQVRRMIAALGGGKENVRLADVEQAGEATFRRVDTNHNGTISQDEIDGKQRLRQQAQMREIEERRNADRLRKEEQARAACRMPAASDAAKIILLSAFNAEALSRIALGSQDVKTGTGEIRIEPGPDPLYVVVVAKDPVIWRLAGATHRVERLVVASAATSKATTPMSVSTGGGTIRLGPTSRPTTVETPAANPVPLVGVTGIERERVSVLPNANCLKHFNEVVSSESASAKAFVRRELGRDPAVVSARINVGSFEIPSGEIRSAYDDKTQPRLVIVKEFGTLKLAGDTSGVVVRTGPIDLDAELEQSSPGGVVNIEEKDVVAIAPLVRYDVLPGPAGLMQLVNSGALSRTRRGEFVISRKIRFPAGLSGHSITFLLRANVPVPDGNADGARVISEETGQEIRLDRK